jgi:hypothetical protein
MTTYYVWPVTSADAGQSSYALNSTPTHNAASPMNGQGLLSSGAPGSASPGSTGKKPRNSGGAASVLRRKKSADGTATPESATRNRHRFEEPVNLEDTNDKVKILFDGNKAVRRGHDTFLGDIPYKTFIELPFFKMAPEERKTLMLFHRKRVLERHSKRRRRAMVKDNSDDVDDVNTSTASGGGGGGGSSSLPPVGDASGVMYLSGEQQAPQPQLSNDSVLELPPPPTKIEEA